MGGRRPLFAAKPQPQQRWGHEEPLSPESVASRLHAEALWKLGYTGKGIKVAVFDTGLAPGVLDGVEEQTNWTDEEGSDDRVGHGTFVASVIGARGGPCAGLAPDALLHIYKVFNSAQVSFTSWFLDAFDHALRKGIHVLNLSIGGPDFADAPFLRKVDEMVAANVIVVSGIGNSGPIWGTILNPADMPSVVGVGGVDEEGRLADFSSRGMSGWERPDGYGRVKPDVLTYAQRVRGLSHERGGGCKTLSGTSVASPVVAGAIALLLSIIPEPRRGQLLNPAVLKQVLTQSAHPLHGRSAYEQGSGAMDLLGAAQMVTEYAPRASSLPPSLNLLPCTPSGEGGQGPLGLGGDGYLWPHCTQPLFVGAMPLLLNLTLLNGAARTARLHREPFFMPTDPDQAGLLSLSFDHADRLWPYGGTLGLALQVAADGATFDGVISGELQIEIENLDAPSGHTLTSLVVPLAVRVVRPPPRTKRLLFDHAHSVSYPRAFVPRDNLAVTDELLDWTGDQLSTNFRDLLIWLRSEGWYVDALGCDLTCFNASQYAALLLVDSEAEYAPLEQRKLRHDVMHKGLSLVVLAEWYNVDVLRTLRFYDENTQTSWAPVTGGSNVPALNELLAPFGVAFGGDVLRVCKSAWRRS